MVAVRKHPRRVGHPRKKEHKNTPGQSRTLRDNSGHCPTPALLKLLFFCKAPRHSFLKAKEERRAVRASVSILFILYILVKTPVPLVAVRKDLCVAHNFHLTSPWVLFWMAHIAAKSLRRLKPRAKVMGPGWG
ncbi:MAG: hypothetical protein JWR26_1996, partial [Pedosphaera sp.]|nr:hypothetical protein [Pedosphaera sp.]